MPLLDSYPDLSSVTGAEILVGFTGPEGSRDTVNFTVGQIRSGLAPAVAVTIKTDSSALTLTGSDDNRLYYYNNASALTITVGNGTADLPVGFSCWIEAAFEAGQITLVGAAGTVPITLQSPNGAPVRLLPGPSRVRLYRKASQLIEVFGETVPPRQATADVDAPLSGVLLGRVSAGAGAIETITLASYFSLSGGQLASPDRSIPLVKLAQSGATAGQAIVWSSTNNRFEPGTVAGGGGIGDFDALPSIPAGAAANNLVLAVSLAGTESKATADALRRYPSGTISASATLTAAQGFSLLLVSSGTADITLSGDLGEGWWTILRYGTVAPAGGRILAVGVTLEDEWGATGTEIVIDPEARAIEIIRAASDRYLVYGAVVPPAIPLDDLAVSGTPSPTTVLLGNGTWGAVPAHDAAAITSGTVAMARIGTGDKNSGTVLHGDGVFRIAATGGGGGDPIVDDGLVSESTSTSVDDGALV